MATDKSNGTGCPHCGIAYSFVFGIQYHKRDCQALAPCNHPMNQGYLSIGCKHDGRAVTLAS